MMVRMRTVDYWCTLFGFYFTVIVGHAHYVNQSQLCVPHDTTCALQLSNIHAVKDDCMMLYHHPNSTECEEMDFNGNSIGQELGVINLVPYYYFHGMQMQSVFNVTFKDIKWKNLRMRFRQNDYHITTKMCREFTLSSDLKIPSSMELFFDCMWSYEKYEGKAYIFESVADNSYRREAHKYIFNVPVHTRIDPASTKMNEWETFMYVDKSTLPLKLRFARAPAKFGIQKYNVSVWINKGLMTTEVIEDPGHRGEMFLEYSCDCDISEGTLQFGVQPMHENCLQEGCFLAQSPKIKLENRVPTTYILLLVCSIIVLATLASIVMWKVFGRRRDYQSKPNVLLIYKPTHELHVKAVRLFVEFLQNSCQTNVQMDELSIPESKSKDPFAWFSNAFAEADCIMVVPSPMYLQQVPEVIYRNLYELGLTFLKQKFLESQSTKFFTVLLPYCTVADIPEEVVNLRSFELLKDFNRMVNYIHDVKSGAITMAKYKNVLDCRNGREFTSRIKQIQETLDKCPRVVKACNKTAENNLKENVLPDTECDLPSDNILAPKTNEEYAIINEKINNVSEKYPFDIKSMDLLGTQKDIEQKLSKGQPTGIILQNLNL